MFRFFFALLLAAVLCSCTPQQRLARLLRHHQELLRHDTIFKNDTFRTKEVSKDTIFNYNSKDTVILKEGKLTVKYFYTHDSVFLKGICAADTIVKKVPYVVTKVVNKPNWGMIAVGLAIFIILLGLLLFLRTVKC